MEIKICRAYVVTGNSEARLTKAIAKQFSIDPGLSAQRARKLEKFEAVREPLCKVRGEVLGRSCNWLYLVEDETAGYVWLMVNVFHPGMVATIKERGGIVDVPADVPTVIL